MLVLFVSRSIGWAIPMRVTTAALAAAGLTGVRERVSPTGADVVTWTGRVRSSFPDGGGRAAPGSGGAAAGSFS